jgi:hypothetical protein
LPRIPSSIARDFVTIDFDNIQGGSVISDRQDRQDRVVNLKIFLSLVSRDNTQEDYADLLQLCEDTQNNFEDDLYAYCQSNLTYSIMITAINMTEANIGTLSNETETTGMKRTVLGVFLKLEIRYNNKLGD